MKKATYILSLLVLLNACGGQETKTAAGNSLEAKYAELAKLKAQQSDLAKQVALLEAEIGKLDPSKAVKPKLVAVSEISPEGFEAYINLQGSVSSENISYVAPRNGMGGYVKELLVKEGQAVKKGQLLMKLDDQVLRQSIAATKTQLAFAQDLFNRNKLLWEQKIGTEVQLLNAKNNVKALEDQIAVQNEQLSTYLVYADQGGVAEVVNIRPGELFSGVGVTGPQLQIVNNNDLSIKVDIPENYTSQVRPGAVVLVEIPAVNKTFKTSISRVSQSVNTTSRGITAVCKIPAADGLKPNMAAAVRILNHSNAKAIVIPVNIVQSDENGKYVFLMEDDGSKKTAKKVNVRLGELYGDQIEILDGLKPGDKLVTRGYQDLYEGQALSNI